VSGAARSPRSILGRGSTPRVRAWFESLGIDVSPSPIRTPADESQGILTRVCLPMRAKGRLYGWIWLLDHGSIDIDRPDAALEQAMALADRAAELLADQGLEEFELGRALHDALNGSSPQRADSEKALARRFADSNGFALVAVSAADGLDVATPINDPGVICRVVSGDLVILAPLRRSGDDRRAVALAVGAVNGCPPTTVGAGIADTFETIDGLLVAYDQARLSARVALADPQFGGVARWSDIGFYRLLEGVGFDASVTALFAEPALLATAEVFLDCAGNVQRAAEQLHVHRQTLYYRLGRIADLTGLDISVNGRDRLTLHLSLKRWRLAGASR